MAASITIFFSVKARPGDGSVSTFVVFTPCLLYLGSALSISKHVPEKDEINTEVDLGIFQTTEFQLLYPERAFTCKSSHVPHGFALKTRSLDLRINISWMEEIVI